MKKITLIFLLHLFALSAFSQTYLIEEDVNKDTIIPKVGFKRKYDLAMYIGIGTMAGSSVNNPPSDIYFGNSWQFREGVWFRRKINNFYAIGAYIEYARESYRMKQPFAFDSADIQYTKWTKQVNNNISAGIFNRINLKSSRFFIDLGAYYSVDVLPRILTKVKPKNAGYELKKITYNKPDIMNRLNYGLDCKVTYGSFALYGKYRLSGLYKNENYDLPKIIIGVMADLRSWALGQGIVETGHALSLRP